MQLFLPDFLWHLSYDAIAFVCHNYLVHIANNCHAIYDLVDGVILRFVTFYDLADVAVFSERYLPTSEIPNGCPC